MVESERRIRGHSVVTVPWRAGEHRRRGECIVVVGGGVVKSGADGMGVEGNAGSP